MKLSISRAADVLLGGGVIAYPTEGVFGLGCLPDDNNAVARLLHIKQRDPHKGLILIAADKSQLDDWIYPDGQIVPDVDASHPTTWIAPAQPHVSPLVRGEHTSVAVRLTNNPTAAAICNAVDAAIVSTSANFSGRPAVRNTLVLRRQFEACVDYIVPGDCGPSQGPSEIRELESGNIIRPRSA